MKISNWKSIPDKFQDSDIVEGMGDQINEFSEQSSPRLTGSPKNVEFIRKDETNFENARRLNKW